MKVDKAEGKRMNVDIKSSSFELEGISCCHVRARQITSFTHLLFCFRHKASTYDLNFDVNGATDQPTDRPLSALFPSLQCPVPPVPLDVLRDDERSLGRE